MVEKYANAFSTFLAAPLSAGGTSASVDAAAPAALQGGQFRVCIDAEILIVTAGETTTTWTVTRGAEGTTGATHATGAEVSHKLTAATIARAGTAFPISKTTDDRYWRTDLAMEFYWNGTYWLSTQEFGAVLAGTDAVTPFTLTNSILRGLLGRGVGSDIYATSTIVDMYVKTTNDASNYWAAVLYHYASADATAIGNTSAVAANTYTLLTLAINATPATGTDHEVAVVFVKVGSPGGLYAVATHFYRLIGT